MRKFSVLMTPLVVLSLSLAACGPASAAEPAMWGEAEVVQTLDIPAPTAGQ